MKAMADYKRYQRTAIAEIADWTPDMDMTDVSISEADRKAGSPKPGDKIARNPKNHADRWLIAADYFAENFAASPQQQAEPCIGNDPSCPCQDDDLCHYRDSPDGKTKAMPIPQQQAEPVAEIKHDKGHPYAIMRKGYMPNGEVIPEGAKLYLHAQQQAEPPKGAARFSYTLKAASGYECEGSYPAVTPEQYEQVVRVLEGAQQAEHSPVPPDEADAANATIGLFSLPTIRVDAETYQWLQSQADLRGLIVQAFVRKTLSEARQQQAEPVAEHLTARVVTHAKRAIFDKALREPGKVINQPHITAEQVEQIKRLVGELESACIDYGYGADGGRMQAEANNVRDETRVAIYAALDVLVKE